ncbi:hypothetical protein RRG08_014397 [Elysia crispata]|uniref:Uncharacterized protein n=1 Tax=Elysia crispata TaxID=231223 RepID=A0AAE0YWJ6_9GAST|nr:hypothetical protein RRG08_014397 [Elysia crispata]
MGKFNDNVYDNSMARAGTYPVRIVRESFRSNVRSSDSPVCQKPLYMFEIAIRHSASPIGDQWPVFVQSVDLMPIAPGLGDNVHCCIGHCLKALMVDLQ